MPLRFRHSPPVVNARCNVSGDHATWYPVVETRRLRPDRTSTIQIPVPLEYAIAPAFGDQAKSLGVTWNEARRLPLSRITSSVEPYFPALWWMNASREPSGDQLGANSAPPLAMRTSPLPSAFARWSSFLPYGPAT